MNFIEKVTNLAVFLSLVLTVSLVGAHSSSSSEFKKKENHMGFKHQIVMFKNRFPGALVSANGHGVYAHDKNGDVLCAVERDGLGRVVDAGSEHGAKFSMSQSPIPRNARVWKLGRDGKISKDEKASERESVARELASKFDGRVPSIEELKKAGWEMKHEYGQDHRAEVVMPKPKAEEPKSEGQGSGEAA
jgi:hypothetical protein